MKTHLYIFGDIDNVRQRIERELFAENLLGLSDISKKLANEIAALADFGRNTFDAEVIVAAGDEILLRLARDKYSLSALALQLHLSCGSESMGDHDSEVMGWLVH